MHLLVNALCLDAPVLNPVSKAVQAQVAEEGPAGLHGWGQSKVCELATLACGKPGAPPPVPGCAVGAEDLVLPRPALPQEGEQGAMVLPTDRITGP